MKSGIVVVAVFAVMAVVSSSAQAGDLGFRFDSIKHKCINPLTKKKGLNPQFVGQCGDWRGTTPALGVFNPTVSGVFDLRGSNFNGVNLSAQIFTGANLNYCLFNRAKLVKTDFRRATANNAKFNRVVAQGVYFTNAVLRDTVFIGAKLHESDFKSADLEDSDFDSALLTDAAFQRANLRGANLNPITTNGGTEWYDAIYDWATVFEVGFDPAAEGMKYVN